MLPEDRRQVVLVAVIVAIVLLLGNITDAVISHFDPSSLRRVWLFGAIGTFTAGIAAVLLRVSRPATFDRVVMLWLTALVGAALLLRTAGTTGYTEGATVLLAFGAYTVLPVPLAFRCIPAVLLTAGNLLIMARWEQAGHSELMPLALLHGAMHAIGIWTSTASQGARRLHYAAQQREREARSEMERIASTDDLTGLLARRRFLEDAEAELRRARRYGSPLSLMIADLDFFKAVNDRWGHPQGDEVLRRFARILREQRRESDLVGRLGGEEFALLLPETTREAALEVAARVLAACRELAVPVGPETIRLTCSLGLSEAGGADRSVTDLLRRADGALYEAKRLGRDQVRVAPG